MIGIKNFRLIIVMTVLVLLMAIAFLYFVMSNDDEIPSKGVFVINTLNTDKNITYSDKVQKLFDTL